MSSGPKSLSPNSCSLVAEALPAADLARNNRLYVAPGSLPQGSQQPLVWKIQAHGRTVILPIDEHREVKSGKIALSSPLRAFFGVSLTDSLTLQPSDSVLPKVTKVTLDVGLVNKAEKNKKSDDAKQVITAFKAHFAGQILNVGMPLLMEFGDHSLLLTPRTLGPESSGTSGCALLDPSDTTEITLGVDPTCKTLQLRGTGRGVISELSFDFKGMGVGGLDDQLRDILTRAFYSRSLGDELVAMYGLEHAKGILLYGPPGTGKTLIARTIAGMFGRTKIKVVNGPELLNKYVGQSEENLRGVFAEAYKEWEQKGPDSDLYVIIFDEIDALFKQRGSRTDGTGVGDTLVNQILTILDGVDSPKNILVIGMTNRKDLLDDALLRKGRLGIHIKIGLPDEHGRREILDIHTKNLKTNGLLDPRVDLNDWAHRTVNFSGADIKALINEASYIANARNFDTKDGRKPVLKDLTKEKPAPVTQEDLEIAFSKVTPSFGIAVSKLGPYLKRNFIPFNKSIQSIIEAVQTDFSTLQSTSDNPTRSILISGSKGVGKTALAVHLALQSKAPLISLLTSGDLAGLSEPERIHKLDTEFKNTQQSKYSVLVLDNLEGILGATRDGRSYSAQMILKLEALLNDPAYSNLLVVGTSSFVPFLHDVGLDSSFRKYDVQKIASYDEVVTILAGLGLHTDRGTVPQESLAPISIKDLLEKVQNFKALYHQSEWDTTAFLHSLPTIDQRTLTVAFGKLSLDSDRILTGTEDQQ